MYKYLKKIPTKEYEAWSNEFYEMHKEKFSTYDREVLVDTFNEFIENLIGKSSNTTKIIADYALTISPLEIFYILF